MNKDLVKQENSTSTSIAAADFLGENLLGQLATANTLEQAGADDVLVPRLYIMQGLSPQLQKGTPEYIKGAETGDIVNGVTKEVFKPEEGGLKVVQVYFESSVVEWKKRDSAGGGGFIRKYATKADAVANSDPEHELIDTHDHYVLAEAKDGSWVPALLSLKKTGLKASRGWNSQIKAISWRSPAGTIYNSGVLRVYTLSTASKSNDKGTFAVPTFTPLDGPMPTTPPEVIRTALGWQNELKQLIQAGKVTAAADADFEVVADEAEDESLPKF